MNVHDLKDSVGELSQEEAMNLIKKRRMSRHKAPKKKKKKSGGGGGGRRKKAPQNIDEVWEALNSEQQKQLFKKMNKKYGE